MKITQEDEDHFQEDEDHFKKSFQEVKINFLSPQCPCHPAKEDNCIAVASRCPGMP
jgi:hypothetical protein